MPPLGQLQEITFKITATAGFGEIWSFTPFHSMRVCVCVHEHTQASLLFVYLVHFPLQTWSGGNELERAISAEFNLHAGTKRFVHLALRAMSATLHMGPTVLV